MSDALFIDVGNLNTLYKVKGVFCMGVNYASCPSQLVIDAQALGSSFDVYLSMLPRIPDEGDVILPSLSVGHIPFAALRREVEAVLGLVEKIPGVNRIYLCNALANFIIPSRVNNFNTVLCYGSRYAVVEVKDKMLSGMRVFDSQTQFYSEYGEDYACYGDIDLIDIEKIRSQYPEFTEMKPSVIVPLVSLIMSYRSNYKLPIDEVRHEMANGYIAHNPKPPVEVPPVRTELPDLELDIVEKPKRHKSNGHSVDWFVVGAGFLCGVLMLINGIGYSLSDVPSKVSTYSNDKTQFDVQRSSYSVLKDIYNAGYNTAGGAASVLSYIASSELPVQITASEVYSDRHMVRFSCTTGEIRDKLVSFVEQKYIVSEINEWGTTVDADQNIIHEYGITIATSN